MWKEILIDDLDGLKEYSDVFNVLDCNIAGGYNFSVNTLKKILSINEEAHCYIYKDNDRTLLRMYKYNADEDKIDVFHSFDSLPLEEGVKRIDETWNICREFISIIGNRHKKIIRISQFPDIIRDDPDFIRLVGTREEYSKEVISRYEEWNIKATEYDNWWEFEV